MLPRVGLKAERKLADSSYTLRTTSWHQQQNERHLIFVSDLGSLVNTGFSLFLSLQNPGLFTLKETLGFIWSVPPTANGKSETSLFKPVVGGCCLQAMQCAIDTRGGKACPWGTFLACFMFQIHLTGGPGKLFLSKAQGAKFYENKIEKIHFLRRKKF